MIDEEGCKAPVGPHTHVTVNRTAAEVRRTLQ
jgi:hypothetical protein